MCVGALVTDTIGATRTGVGMAVLLGWRPGMLMGKHCEAIGSVMLKSFFVHVGDVKVPSLASMSRSTSMP